MEKLPKEEQDKIRKTSTERLKEGLLKVHYAKKELEKMDRDTLMNTWAQVLMVRMQAQEGAEGRFGVDPELERARLEFEKYKFAMEMEKEKAS